MTSSHEPAPIDIAPADPGGYAGTGDDWDRHPFLQPVDLPFTLPTRIYGGMLAVWHYHRYLQQRFPLHEDHPRSYLQFLAWCATMGRRKHRLLREIPAWDDELGSAIALPALAGDRWHDSFSAGQFLYGVAHYHYAVSPMLRNLRARDRVARVFWRRERHSMSMPPPQDWQARQLDNLFGSIDGLARALRNPLTERRLAGRALIAALQLSDIEPPARPIAGHPTVTDEMASRPSLSSPEHAHNEPALRLPRLGWFAVDAGIRARRSKQPLPDNQRLTGITRPLVPTLRTRGHNPYPFGVNLFGHAHGELGIGEDVRLVAKSLDATGIPFCIINFKPGPSVSQADTSVAHWVTGTPRYAINLFCMTGMEQVRYTGEQGLSVFRDRYTIGLWPWELPRWPESCRHAYNLVDEIWGISRYTANAYSDAPCPVHPMTLPVTVDEVATLGRSDFGLPADRYLFIFAFDVNSTFARKNPGAVIDAFQQAFPQNAKERVGLVIKASHVRTRNPEWRRLKKLADSDPRITIVSETLRRPEVLALYKACDCVVSLHRAEGFGRGIAEALLLDKQVIATGHSGNLDYCDPRRVALVRFGERAVQPGEYFHSEGQTWADPDVAHAAELMAEIIANPKPLDVGNADFSPRHVGQRYADRLKQIGALLDIAPAP